MINPVRIWSCIDTRSCSVVHDFFSTTLARRHVPLFTPEFHLKDEQKGAGQAGSHSPKQDCLLGESFIRCGQVQDAVRL